MKIVKKKYCWKCIYRGRLQKEGFECNYCFLTGHSRLARTSPEQRAAGECPVREEGKQRKGVPQKGLARSYPFKVDRIKLRTLYDRGLNDAEIAREIGCSESTVFNWRHENELPANAKKGGWHPRRGDTSSVGCADSFPSRGSQ